MQYINKGQNSLDELKKLYQAHFANSYLNETSLTVLHKPILSLKVARLALTVNRSRGHYWNNPSRRQPIRPFGQLLLGDLKVNDNTLDQICAKWTVAVRDEVYVFQVPHHGANNYLVNRFFQEFAKARICTVNFGLGNTFKHPRSQVIDILRTHMSRRAILLNTQVSDVTIDYFLRFN